MSCCLIVAVSVKLAASQPAIEVEGQAKEVSCPKARLTSLLTQPVPDRVSETAPLQLSPLQPKVKKFANRIFVKPVITVEEAEGQ